jgi:hypothetical protein
MAVIGLGKADIPQAALIITHPITLLMPAVQAIQNEQTIAGLLLSGAPPVAATPGPPTLQRLSLACAGGTAVVRLTSNTPFAEVAVDVQGVGSFWHVLLPTPTQAVDVLVSLAQTLPGSLTWEYRLGTAQGPLGQATVQRLDTTCGATGDVQVSLTWDTPTDLDLYVRDPNGVLIFFGNRSPSNSAGRLELDSNPGCRIDGRNTENITWPAGTAPNGAYTVLVDLFSACSTQGTTNFVVTINVRGRSPQIVRGTFAASEASGGSQPRTIRTFTLP